MHVRNDFECIKEGTVCSQNFHELGDFALILYLYLLVPYHLFDIDTTFEPSLCNSISNKLLHKCYMT